MLSNVTHRPQYPLPQPHPRVALAVSLDALQSRDHGSQGEQLQRYIAIRFLLFIPTVFLVTLGIFLLMRVIPGDPALLRLTGISGEGSYTQQDLDNLRQNLGTDKPIYEQYRIWIWDLIRGDLGTSLYSNTPVTDEIAPRLPLTIELAILATVLSLIIAVPLGAVSALHQDSLVDYAARIFTFTGISVPIFVTGLVVIYLLVHVFGWFPPLQYADIWDKPWQNVQQMFFPALTLAFFQMNFTARVTRSALLEVMREDYIRTARAKGLRERTVIYVHALRNAMLPIVTVSGWSFGFLLGGTIIIERIFVIPGMGLLLLDAVIARNYTLIQAAVLIFALCILAVNLAVDLVYAWLDPKIRYA